MSESPLTVVALVGSLPLFNQDIEDQAMPDELRTWMAGFASFLAE